MRFEQLIHEQDGVVSRAQALACGFSPTEIQTELDRARWAHFFPSVYWVKAVKRTPMQRVTAAHLWAKDEGCLSHATAAWLWKLPGFENLPWKLDLILPRNGGKAPAGLAAHRPRDFERSECVIHRGVRVTSLERTILDLAPGLHRERLEDALDTARRMQPETFLNQMAAVLARHRGPGQAGLKELERMLKVRLNVAATDSWLEDRILAALLKSGLPMPRHQYEVWDGAEYVMRVDFFWESARLALHADSYLFHRDAKEIARDARQRRHLARLGIRSAVVTMRDLENGQWLEDLRVLLGVMKQSELGLVASDSQNDR